MEDKSFLFTPELTKKMLKLRFQNDWLFKKEKQPWREFHKLLLENGFPEEMTVAQVRKKWSYQLDMYKIAKRAKNKSWKFYSIFDKHFGRSKGLDKYEAWSDEWRFKLIICVTEAKDLKTDLQLRTVETAMRSQDLPINCCIQDLQGLWHHLKVIFNRSHRRVLKNGSKSTEWSLYEPMLEYFKQNNPSYLSNIETNNQFCDEVKLLECKRSGVSHQNVADPNEFNWTKNITESFIQLRLQHDWLFKGKSWAWNNFYSIMVEEYGFPKILTGRMLCKKWASIYRDYQKAKAKNNTSWVYFSLFELYMGEEKLNLNPLAGWSEEWIINLISARTDLDHVFKFEKNRIVGWREVEKRLRTIGLPLDHTLLDLTDKWMHLQRTYGWKQKFANKGMLNAHWTYFEAMKYFTNHCSQPIKKHEHTDYNDNDDYDDDDIKLFDLKQKWQVKPKVEVIETNQCRSCSNGEACVNLFEQDMEGLDLAYKLRVVGGIEVDRTENLPSQICLGCLQELENAYKFRRKCQEVDKIMRNNQTQPSEIKLEMNQLTEPDNFRDVDAEMDGDFHDDGEDKIPIKKMKKENRQVMKKVNQRKQRYDYWQICEVCGKSTRNLTSHMDMHAVEKAYSCEVCDKKFKFKSTLVIHRAVHNPTPRKTCEVCGKTFHILAQYRKHFVYHANERKFECETCGKRFNTLDILKVHNRTHTDERPFTCSDCGKTFRTAGCVSRHKRIVHRKIKVQNV